MSIQRLVARTIYDSRGHPTVECDLWTEAGCFRASVPSGASTGKHEAHELRDGVAADWGGKGVLKAIDNIHRVIDPALKGMDTTDLTKLDDRLRELDGTENKTNLGANAILAVSMAACRAGAAHKKVPLYCHIGQLAGNTRMILPVPCFNVINGGSHAGNALAMQEFLICPTGAKSFSEALKMASETYHTLKNIINDRYGIDSVNVGDEGGFAPPLENGTEALELLDTAIQAAGYKNLIQVAFDAASSEFFQDGRYNLTYKKADDPGERRLLSGEELSKIYEEMAEGRNLAFMEDPFAEDDWAPSVELVSKMNIEVVGDDMLCTNPTRIKRGIKDKAMNALLLKLNQIGTVTESIEAARLAKDAGWGILTSHRSGETADDFIADLAVGLATGHIKTGAPCRGERLAKYNQLLRIEEQLRQQGKGSYAGKEYRQVIWTKP